jgi:hypothetical protein
MAAKKERSNVPAEKLALYDKLLEANPEIERKGAKIPYTSHNGWMFSFLSDTGSLALRMPKEEREIFMKKYDAKLRVAYGITMPEFVEVPDKLFANTKELKKYFDISHNYVKSLKPKPTKKKKK